jgi:hypothetical protein
MMALPPITRDEVWTINVKIFLQLYGSKKAKIF